MSVGELLHLTRWSPLDRDREEAARQSVVLRSLVQMASKPYAGDTQTTREDRLAGFRSSAIRARFAGVRHDVGELAAELNRRGSTELTAAKLLAGPLSVITIPPRNSLRSRKSGVNWQKDFVPRNTL